MTDRPLDRIPPAIQWHEGMLLMPQHFQQMAARGETLTAYQLGLATPYPWGVERLAIDRGRLVNGVLRIDQLEAVMPDGTIIHHPAAECGLLEIDLAPFADAAKQAPQRVHVVMPAPIETAAQGGAERYRSVESAPLADEAGGSEIRVPQLLPNLALLVANAPAKRWVALPVADITYRDEKFELTEYVPPCTRLAPDSPLGSACLEVAKRTREKASFLAETARTNAPNAAGAMEVRWTVQSMLLGLPQLEALVYSGVAHPLQVYVALCGLTGQFTALGASAFPPVPAPYDHADLRALFERPLAFLNLSLDRVRPDFLAVPFDPTDAGFRLKLKDGWIKRRLTIGLKVPDGVSEAATAKWFMNSQIGASGRLDGLLERRVLGAPRRPVDPEERTHIQPGRGMLLFTIDTLPEFVAIGDFLEIANSGQKGDPARPAEMILYLPLHKADTP